VQKKLLLTAFEPFDDEALNPSLEVARALAGVQCAGAHIDVIELPVERFRAIDLALDYLRHQAPDVVIMLGEAGRRFRVTPERVAINTDDFSIPDNAGHQPKGEPIIAGGPVGYFSALPIYEIVNQLRKAHIPAAISNSAGTYLCNRLFYSVMHCIAVEQWPIIAGFIHLPYMHEQTVNKRLEFPSLSRDTIIDAVRRAIAVSLHTSAPAYMQPDAVSTRL
jgi:pyroglutamyl-peptidase